MKIHMVKSGDTMYTIAQKYGVKLEQLIAYNPQITNPDQIEVGMKVKIPSAAIPDGTPAVEYAHKHVVVQGDSLWKIAKAWGLPLKALIDANPQLKNPSVLLTGEVVNIPKSAHMPNQGTSNTMNTMQTPIQSNVPNSISPAYVPQPINAPQPAAVQPVTVNETPPKPIEQLVQPEEKLPVAAEANNENIHIHTSETLFMQFDVPAVKAEGKAENMPIHTMSEWNPTEIPQWGASPEEMPQWGSSPTEMQQWGPSPTEMPQWGASPAEMQQWGASPAEMQQWAPSPAYGAKPDCGCGCGDKGNAMPYNPYQAPNSTSPAYYIPEPMLGYSMQDPMQGQPQQPMQESYYNPMQESMANPMPMQPYAQPNSYNPMQFPTSAAAPSSPYGYMIPCYPMGAYGDMNHLHGMQTPYSPWLNSNENAPPVNTLAESAENANINQQMNSVLGGASDANAPVKKRTKIPRKSSSRSSQKQNDRAQLHNFLQKKSSGRVTSHELKINEPWMNR